MNDFEAYAALQRRGMSIIRGAGEASEFSKKHNRELHALHEVYFVRKDAVKKQAQAVAAAEENGHSVETLIAIERIVSQLDERKHAWNLRRELCRTAGTHEQIVKRGRARLNELNSPKPASRGARIRHGRDNTSRMTLRDDRNRLTALYNATGETEPEKVLDALYGLAFGGGTTAPAITPAAIIHLDDSVRIHRGDDDVQLTLTDGSVLTGKEFAERALADAGYAVLVSEMEGPVDAYRMERRANKKQRLLASVVSPICAWFGCNAAADASEVHHVREWKEGGATNIDNLCILCKYHNGINGQPGRGRMVMVDGVPMWHPPWGGPPIRNDHPALAHAAL